MDYNRAPGHSNRSSPIWLTGASTMPAIPVTTIASSKHYRISHNFHVQGNLCCRFFLLFRQNHEKQMKKRVERQKKSWKSLNEAKGPFPTFQNPRIWRYSLFDKHLKPVFASFLPSSLCSSSFLPYFLIWSGDTPHKSSTLTQSRVHTVEPILVYTTWKRTTNTICTCFTLWRSIGQQPSLWH